MNSEAVYDKEIYPLLEQIAEICKNNDISFNMLFQYGPNLEDHASVLSPRDNESTKMFISRAAIQCMGNVDSLFIAIAQKAEEVGHSSLVLKVLGNGNA